jgi:NAD(P)H-hydrate repair Nnr-like enzyme with NAD(P)H-hydrate dehydratase domain
MDQEYWLKQTDTPLYPQLEWSRPENKAQAGKLLIIGGNSHGFAGPAEAYGAAMKAGAGMVRVLLPESLRKAVGKLFPEAEFAPSTPSGSFASQALAELVDASEWANGILFAGDSSRNSETSVLLENFLEKFSGQVTLVKDAADIICQQPFTVLQRPDTLLAVSMGQLRRLGGEARFPRAFTSEMGLVQLIGALHEFTKRYAFTIITRHQGNLILAQGGQVCTTKLQQPTALWRLATGAAASVWWMQHPTKPYEALVTCLYNLR